jgi:hypothetical protein
VQNIKIARDAVVSLILGSPIGKSLFDEVVTPALVVIVAGDADWYPRQSAQPLENCWSENEAAFLKRG